jgi:hypothetical protein
MAPVTTLKIRPMSRCHTLNRSGKKESEKKGSEPFFVKGRPTRQDWIKKRALTPFLWAWGYGFDIWGQIFGVRVKTYRIRSQSPISNGVRFLYAAWMPRVTRNCPADLPVHVIQRGNNRQACFASDSDFKAFAHWLFEGASRFSVDIHAWVFMTNHVLCEASHK